MASRNPSGISKRDILAKAAACDRALSVVTNPECREIFRHLQKLWTELAKERPAVLEAHFVDEISLLAYLQLQMTASVVH